MVKIAVGKIEKVLEKQGVLHIKTVMDILSEKRSLFMGKNGDADESPPGETMYRANPDFMLREIAGETLLVPTGEIAHKMNAAIILTESAAILWKHLSQSQQTKCELKNILMEEYDASSRQADKDVDFFLEKAHEKDLIIRAKK